MTDSSVPALIDAKWAMFIRVAELGSVTHAAAVMGTTQSVVSRQIGLLESECGSRLFRRTGRGVALTNFGSQIFPRLKALAAQADLLADDIRTSSGEAVGDVRIGLLPFSVAQLAGPLYRSIAARFPKIHLHLTEGSSVQLEDWLNQGRLDLSLLLRENDIEEPGEETLRQLSLSLLGPRADPITASATIEFRALENLPLVLPSEPHLLRARLTALARERQVALRIAVEADSINLQREVVAAGGGYAIVADNTIPGHEVDRFSKSLIIEPQLSRRIVLRSTTLRPDSMAARAVTRLIKELAPVVFPPA